jgi:hypothetical protein
MPALARTTERPSPLTSQAIPSRGCHMSESSGMVPSEGKAMPLLVWPMNGAKNTSPGGVIVSGWSIASQRRPKSTETLGRGRQVSWRNTAGSSCSMSWVPACSTVSPPTPACWR